MPFSPATKRASRLRMAISGPSGSGKTYTSLTLAAALCDEGQRVAVIDTERGSASKYSDTFSFDVMELETYSPLLYVDAIREAEATGEYGVLVIDSLSHAWSGVGGALELKDQATARAKGNSYVAWGEITPLQNKLVDTILQAKLHVICTMRSKQAYVQENEGGRTRIRKVGMEPVQRDGMEYEFDLFGEMDQDNNLVVTKTRCPALNRAVINKPGADLAFTIAQWLQDGAPPPTIEQQIASCSVVDALTAIYTRMTPDERDTYLTALSARKAALQAQA
jgi:nucleoside-triphosphatase THEP1